MSLTNISTYGKLFLLDSRNKQISVGAFKDNDKFKKLFAPALTEENIFDILENGDFKDEPYAFIGFSMDTIMLSSFDEIKKFMEENNIEAIGIVFTDYILEELYFKSYIYYINKNGYSTLVKTSLEGDELIQGMIDELESLFQIFDSSDEIICRKIEEMKDAITIEIHENTYRNFPIFEKKLVKLHEKVLRENFEVDHREEEF